jgi:hypothetical protein
MSEELKLYLLREVAKESGLPFPYSDNEIKQMPDFLESLTVIGTGIQIIIKMLNQKTGKLN